jgi:DNA gyrase/topoisomerase IV subunit B
MNGLLSKASFLDKHSLKLKRKESEMASNYGDDAIVTLTGVEHYRFRPTMYGFRTADCEGPLLQIKELVDNAVDEALDPKRVYPIKVTFFVSKDKSMYQCMVQDFGRGIPVNKLEACLATANTSGKYKNDGYAQGGGAIGSNGVGSKVVAALSKTFIAFTKRRDGFAHLKVYQGKVKESNPQRKLLDKDWTTDGTLVMFQPDDEVLFAIKDMFNPCQLFEGRTGFDILKERMELYPLFRRNIQMQVRVVDGMLKPADLNKAPGDLWKYLTNDSNFKFADTWSTPLGLTPRDYIIGKYKLKTPIWDLGEPLVRVSDPNNEADRLSYEVDVFLDDKSLAGDNVIVGAVNSTPINDPQSIHITMLHEVMKMYLEGYILDKDKSAFFSSKYQLPISGFVSVRWLGAAYDGQDKKKFTSREFGEAYRVFLRRQLNKLPENVWERLYEIISDNFEAAYAKYARAQFKVGSDLKGMAYRLKRSGSYVPCESRDREMIELFITEGDSAAGRVKTVRDGRFQALFKLSGKPINAARVDTKRLVKNLIYQDLLEIIGVRPTDTDLSNMKFSKIFILADADSDGKHITALLIGIINEINPRILEEGRVFISCPPLYSFFVQGQKRPFYLRDMDALQNIKNVIYREFLDIYVQKGKQKGIRLEGDYFNSLCFIVNEIGDRVKYVADQLNIGPMDLERMLHVVDYLDEDKPNVNKIKEILQVDEVLWNKEYGTLVLVDGGFDTPISLSHLQHTLRTTVLPYYEKYHWNDFNLFVSTRHTETFVQAPCTFMMLHQIFTDITDSTNSKTFVIRRFKGLGEMSEEDIEETCINRQTRTAIRIEGIGDVNKIYDMLGSDSDARKKLVNNSEHDRFVDAGMID